MQETNFKVISGQEGRSVCLSRQFKIPVTVSAHQKGT